MNRLRSSAIVATTLVLLAGTHAAANQLLNAGFETDAILDQPISPFVSDWSTFNGAAQASANVDPVRSGIGSLALVGGGGFGVPGAFQTFPALPGQVWGVSGYMLTKTPVTGDATNAIFKIVFGDGTQDLPPGLVLAGQADAPAFPGIVSLPKIVPASPANTWQLSQARGVAPAGTVEVRIFALLVDQNAATVYADDVLAGLAGDFNTDIKVNATDLTVWQTAFNANTAGGDGNGDGLTDGADILIWQQGLNPALGAVPAVGAVPEPSCALLFAAGLAVMGRRGMKKLAR